MTTAAEVRTALGGYQTARARLAELQTRRARIRAELEQSGGGLNLDGMPKGSEVTDGMDKAAGLIDKIKEIDRDILVQQADAARILAAIISAIDTLPGTMPERRAMELKYIDLLPAERAAEIMGISPRHFWRKIKTGAEIIAGTEAGQKLVIEWHPKP